MADGPRVAVVGGGIAGLAAATFAARAGARVTLFERLAEPGGRARTRLERGFAFNMGPHALYLAGVGRAALRELGLDPAGERPPAADGLAYQEGQLYDLPGALRSLLATRLLGAREKLELVRVLARMRRADPQALAGVPLADWLADVRSPRVRDLALALVRVTSYANAPERMSAGAALQQLGLGLAGGVRYLHGGWQRMVDALAARAREAGAELRSGARVERVAHDGALRGLELEGGERVAADAAILALGPAEASALVDAGQQPALAAAEAACVPVRAACLDLGLARLPDPQRCFALGIERPLYLSVHSAVARDLAPAGGALVQVARYLEPGEHPEREEIAEELERMLDAVQPGWREHVVARRVMRELTVSHDLPQAARGGLAGRTPGALPGIAGLWLAGDWVGPEGMLADAALASARAAARAAAHACGLRAAA